MKLDFIKGLDLSERFYNEAVRLLLTKHYPTLRYSAALIGQGSEVLGFDTPQSTDHDWGPRLMLFLTEADYQAHQDEINQMLRRELPPTIHGYPTNFGSHDDGTGALRETDGPINHRVMLLTVRGFFQYVLKFDPTGDIDVIDWISVPENHLLMMTAGRVFHDGLGQLEPIREKLDYYPDDVWLYLLSVQWRRIGQEEHFMGRCGQVGDDLGSRLVAGRLVKDLMRLCFLMERTYTPYIKWFGSAFAQLDCAATLSPILQQVLSADSWEKRQDHLSAAYEFVAQMHNDLDITAPLSVEVSSFHNRPFLVIHAGRFEEAIRAEIRSEEVLALPQHLGGFDQFVDSTDAQGYLQQVKGIYG